MSRPAISAEPFGIGMVYLPGLEALADSLAGECDLIEVEPQAFWRKRSAAGGEACESYDLAEEKFAALKALGKPVLVHSVGCPVAGSNGFDPAQIAGLRQTLALLRPPCWRDLASFNSVGRGAARRSVGLLMPPRQSAESVAMIVDLIRELQDAIGLPFAFETGVNYFRPQPGDMPDGAFWGEIAERAECGILLDLHNIWANERNGRTDARDLLDALPLERVWELHIAGGQQHKGYWLDAHSGLPCEDVLDLLEHTLPRLPNLGALLFEIVPDYVEAAAISSLDLHDLLSRMREIRDTCAAEPAPSPRRRKPADTVVPIGHGLAGATHPEDWENEICRNLAAHRHGDLGAVEADPAFEIYFDLIQMMRRGTIVATLPLTARYLWLLYGEQGVEALLDEYFAITVPHLFMADEARNFAHYIEGKCSEAPHLADVAAFEFAAQRAALSGESQVIAFGCDPVPLIAAIKRGAPPAALRSAAVELEVLPPAMSAA